MPSDIYDPMYEDNLWRTALYNGVEVVLLNVSEVEQFTCDCCNIRIEVCKAADSRYH